MSKPPKVGSSANPITWVFIFLALASFFYLGYWFWLVFSAISQGWEALTFFQEIQIMIGLVIIMFWLVSILFHHTTE